MTLLEDARRLAGFGPYFKRGDEATCWYCRATVIANEPYHAVDCPWLSMPKIVAVLECVEQVASLFEEDTRLGGDARLAAQVLEIEARMYALVREG